MKASQEIAREILFIDAKDMCDRDVKRKSDKACIKKIKKCRDFRLSVLNTCLKLVIEGFNYNLKQIWLVLILGVGTYLGIFLP